MKPKTLFYSSLIAAAAMSTVPAFADAETIQISYGSNNNEAKDGGGTITFDESTKWNKATNNSNSDSAASIKLYDSTGTETTATTTWTSKNTWCLPSATAASADEVLKGYLDDGSEGSITGITITVSNISYLVYDVTVIASTDTANKQYTAKTINGQTYTSDGSGNGILGSTVWGSTNTTTVGNDNSFTVSGLTGDLSLSSTGSNTSNRGCVAGLIITDGASGVSAVAATLSGTASTWTTTSLAGTDWTNSSETTPTYANLTMSADNKLTLESGVITDAIWAHGSGALTLAGEEELTFRGVGVLRADSGTSIVVTNTLNFTEGGTLSGTIATSGNGVLKVSGGTLNAAASAVASLNVSVDSGATYALSGFGITEVLAKVSGAGTVAVVGGVSTFTEGETQSRITLNNVSDTSAFTGTVELRNVQAVVSGSSASSFANASKVVLNSAALHFNNDAATFSKDIEIGSGQNGYIRSYGYNKIASGAGATIAGNVSGEGTLTSSDDGDVTFSGTVDIGAYVARKSGGISVFSGDSTKIGTLTMNDGTTVNFTAGTNEITTANVSGGTLDISDSTSTTITTANFSGGTISGGNITTANVTSGTVAVSGSTIGTLKQTGGTVNFSGKTALTNLGISQGTVNVSSVLNVSGSANGTKISEASFFLNDSGTGTLNVKSGGVVNVTSAHISVRDGTGTLNVETGGEINFGTGLNVTKNGNWGAATFNLNGGRINVGSSGIQRPSLSVVTYNFNSGTIGSLADSWSSTENLVFGGAITIDTAKKTINENGAATDAGTGSTSAITLSGGLTFSGDDSALKISGDGSVTLGGTVYGATVGTDAAAKITVGSGSTLTLNASSLVYALTGPDESINGKTLNIATGDGTISTTGTLSHANFTWNGNTLSGRTEVSLSNGSVSFSGVAASLVWTGSVSSTWDTTTQNWTNGTSGDTFYYKDNVTFNTSGASVSLGEAITAGTVTVSANTTITATSTNTLTADSISVSAGTLTLSGQQYVSAGSIDIAEGATVNFGSVAGISQNLAGEGAVSLNSTSHGGTINLGTDFKGSVNISGSVGLDNHKFGADTAKLYISNPSGGTETHIWSPTASAQEITQAITFKNGSTIRVGGWGSKTTTLTLSGDLTFENGASFVIADSSAGNGTAITVDITGAVKNGNFTLNSGSEAGTLTFSGTGKNTIETLNVKGGKTNFSGTGTTAITGDISVSGGATVEQSAGTVSATRLILDDSDAKKACFYTLSGGVLNISGTGKQDQTVIKDNKTEPVTTDNAILLGHWPSTNSSNAASVLTVSDGVLNATAGFTTISWDSAGTLTVSGGEANLYGISLNTNRANAANVTLSGDGRLNIGAGGLVYHNNTSGTNPTSNKTVTLSGGTLGALDDWSSTVAMTVNGDVTIDTTKMETSSSGESSATSEGATIALEGALSGVGGLMKSGAGTLKLSGANTFTGDVTVTAGTLEAANTSALGSSGTTTVNEGGVLKVSVADGVNAGTGAVKFASGAKFAIDLTAYSDVEVDNALSIITASAISFNDRSLGTVTLTSEEIEKYFSATDSNLGDWATGYTRTWGYDATNSALTLTLTVPEPSTFGLLAGVGALALVAARRRRRAK